MFIFSVLFDLCPLLLTTGNMISITNDKVNIPLLIPFLGSRCGDTNKQSDKHIFSSIPLEAEQRPQHASIWKGVQYLQLTKGRRLALLFIRDWHKLYWNRTKPLNTSGMFITSSCESTQQRNCLKKQILQNLVLSKKKQSQRTCRKHPVSVNKMAVGMYLSK